MLVTKPEHLIGLFILDYNDAVNWWRQKHGEHVQALEDDLRKERASVTRAGLIKSDAEQKIATMEADMVVFISFVNTMTFEMEYFCTVFFQQSIAIHSKCSMICSCKKHFLRSCGCFYHQKLYLKSSNTYCSNRNYGRRNTRQSRREQCFLKKKFEQMSLSFILV